MHQANNNVCLQKDWGVPKSVSLCILCVHFYSTQVSSGFLVCVCGGVDEIHESTFTALVDSLIWRTLTHRFVLSLSLLQIYPPLCLPMPLHICTRCACLPNQYSPLGLKQGCMPNVTIKLCTAFPQDSISCKLVNNSLITVRKSLSYNYHAIVQVVSLFIRMILNLLLST